ncbi:MAG: sterol desaturase family protein [Deltaproteobacteria bacterium]|nr:sterol desaturase family protein [Deltaproteobacteria bacterium]
MRIVELVRGRERGPLSRGRVSGAVALALGALAVLAVLAFHFPEYLTTPELRRKYDVAVLRHVLLGAMVLAGGVSLANLILGRSRWLATSAFALVTLAALLGGHRVPVGNFPDGTPYVGLDWFILDLLGSALVFVFLETLFPLRPAQPMLRAEWSTDLGYFAVNHLLIGVVLVVVNEGVHRLFDWAMVPAVGEWVRARPLAVELAMAVLAADLVQYAVHRLYHRVPLLWRFHAIHHSARTLDWLAGSRLHVLETVVTRIAVLGALYLLGFSRPAMDLYIVIVGFQAVLIHSNVRWPWGWLRYVLVTPDFHHWHHGSERAAIDRNFAAHLAFLDHLFGTAVQRPGRLPERYGVADEGVPAGFWAQQVAPFRR